MCFNKVKYVKKLTDKGFPTHDKAGETLSKAAIKKLIKEKEKQEEVYSKYLAKEQG